MGNLTVPLYLKWSIIAIANSLTGYSKYEVETNDIPMDVLKKIAKYYITSINYLLYMTDERKPYPKSILDNEKTSSK